MSHNDAPTETLPAAPTETLPAAPDVTNVASAQPPTPLHPDVPHPALLGWCEASLNIYVQDHRVSLLLPR